MARRFGSAMISNTDSMLLIYAMWHIRVKGYTKQASVEICGKVGAAVSGGVRRCTERPAGQTQNQDASFRSSLGAGLGKGVARGPVFGRESYVPEGGIRE